MRDAVIVEAVRTPVGRRNGGLAESTRSTCPRPSWTRCWTAPGIEPGTVDDVVWGCVGQVGEQAGNIARNAVLAAGWPESVPGTTIDRQCGSSQQAVHFAAAGVIVRAVRRRGRRRRRVDDPGADGVGASRRPRRAVQRRGPASATTGIEFNQGVGAEMIAARWGFAAAGSTSTRCAQPPAGRAGRRRRDASTARSCP